MSKHNPWIVETTNETFEKDVIERSHERPVVVDFWAPWCGPCRMLGPVLERLAEEGDGAFVLVKANTEELPEIASGFGIRSIPAVFGLSGGRVKDSFVGVLGEAAIRAFLDGLKPTPSEPVVRAPRGLAPTAPAAASAPCAGAPRPRPAGRTRP